MWKSLIIFTTVACNVSTTCVEDLCPKPNEVYDECPAPCPPRRCDVDERVIRCGAPPKPDDCKPGCRCADGYFRNSKGVCVTRDQCDSCPRPNEVYDVCPAPCPPQRCGVDITLILCAPSPKPGDKECVPGCRCIDGYVRNDENACIPTDQCPKCTKPNEFYDSCPPTYPPQTCESLDKGYSCPRGSETNECNGACRCNPGYYRNKLGECISEENCRKCSGPHEYFSCGGACDNVCATLSVQNQTSCPIINIVCNKMCYCEDGYARDDNNICIPIKQCKDPRCGKNERLEQCPNNLCTPQKCSDLGFPWPAVPCPMPDNGTCSGPPGCVCDYDYVRDDNGVCILKRDCPSCGGDPNAVSGCGLNCGRLCSNYDKGPVPCPRICYHNACDCKEGYVFDENIKKCVLPQNCSPICNTNEVYDGCANGGCRRWSCSEPKICIYPYICQGGCVCQENYTRAENGTCIPEDQCGLQCNKPNEYLDNCPITCPPQTCESIGKEYHCPIQATVCREPDCRCKKGYYRNTNGDCITEEECKKCTGPHEYFACGGECDNVCATINKQNQTNCPIINIQCNPKCYCEKNYARDENGTCIPIEQCPAPQCADNEIFEQCPENLCVPLTCSQLGFPINCTTSSDDCNASCRGEPRCICDNGNVRDDSGNCIPREQCPSCGGDRNATSGCGINCGRRCSNYKKTNVACILSCSLNGCDCKDSYVFDDNKKICVLPEDCGPVCGPNERYEENPASLCEPLSCSELGFPLDCSTTDNCRNKPGCICRKGFVRNSHGFCVKKSECPSCGGDRNAVAGCGVNCGKTCSSYGRNDTQCIQVCHPNACDCRKGFVFDEVIGKCVRYKNCSCKGGSHNTSPTTSSPPPPTPVTQMPPQSSSNVNVTEAKAKLDQGCVALSHEFIYQMSQSNPDDNFVVSAASVLIPLAQLALFAVDPVFTALMKVLNIDSKDEIKSVYLLETPNYANQQNVEFELATKYYANENYPLSDAFKSDSKKYFNASGENLDFSNNKAAAATINTWVEERTHDRIKDLMSADSLNANTVAVLVNAIYFLGNWVYQFNANYTETRDFTKRNGNVVQLDTMYQENRFNYGEVNNLNLQCLEMEYKNFNFSMFIILPKAGYFDDTIKTLRNDREAFNRIRNSMRYEKVQVYLPKMEINTNVPLGDLLKKAGLSSMFDPSSDGFKGILANDRSLYVSNAIQKAFMKSDEKGTEAAAATAITVSTTSAVIGPPQIYEFKVNRPALFYILFQGVPHFCGVFAGAS